MQNLFRRHRPAKSSQPLSMRLSSAVPPELRRPFRAIIFDWDGTAVVDRQEDAMPLVAIAESLIDEQVWLVVVTGTNFPNIDRQFCQHVAPPRRHHLLICVNRGSEVYGFDHTGLTVRRWARTATPDEERALSTVAEEVRDQLRQRCHLDVTLIYNRLNRRKIDLIPLPEWADPPKSQIAALLAAVTQRLDSAGIPAGINGIIQMAAAASQRVGLATRITSDVKHIEVGLTDKADAIAWCERELLRPEGIAWRDVLIAGDEFGAIAGFPGSDDRLRVGTGEAPVVSVGVEPNGVPAGVIALGGGPAHFRAILADQVERHLSTLTAAIGSAREERREAIIAELGTSPDPAWSFLLPGYVPKVEPAVESQLALSNGFMGMRGSLDLPAAAAHPRMLVAGLFARSPDPPIIPVLVSGPDWACLTITVDGRTLTAENATSVLRTLDYQHGFLRIEWTFVLDEEQTVMLRTVRGLSLAERAFGWHLARLDVTRPAKITLESKLIPLDPLLLMRWTSTYTQLGQSEDGHHHLAIASTAQLDLPDQGIAPTAQGDWARRRWEWDGMPTQPAFYHRVVTVVRADAEAAIAEAALDSLYRIQHTGLADLLDAHRHAWDQCWRVADIVLGGDDPVQRALRFAIFHLIGAANPQDSRVSIGARALTGDGYHGHVFWDTEIFLLPFYIFTWPAAAQAMLRYRYRTLPAARAKAASMGYKGALFAWESADTGEEATPITVVDQAGKTIPVLNGVQEQHVTADIAYAVWQYWLATGDEAFWLDCGAEIIIETARFWASRAALEQDGRYHIRRVIGPDEYHTAIDDNAFTNGMARWNLERAAEAVTMLAKTWTTHWQSFANRLAITAAEIDTWRAIAARLVTGLDPATHILEQFAGYHQLEAIDLGRYTDRSLPIDVLLGADRIQQSQVVKQADVVMLTALLWEHFDLTTIAANFDYYEPRTTHGSSLSPAMHALVAARLGDLDRATAYYRQAIAIDTADQNGNEAQGIHIATQAGIWQATVLGFAGLYVTADGLCLTPHLPETWQQIAFTIHWHARQVHFTIAANPLTVTITLRGDACALRLGEQRVMATPGDPTSFAWHADRQQWIGSR